jgi:hypothetical protein
LNRVELPIHVQERDGLPRKTEAIRIGVPLPRGRVHQPTELVLTNAAGERIAYQLRALALWADRSIKWLLIDALVQVQSYERTTLLLRTAGDDAHEGAAVPTLDVESRDDTFEIDTGVARFTIARQGAPISRVQIAATGLLQGVGSMIRLTDASGSHYDLDIERVGVEEQGPLRATLLTEGRFRGVRRLPLRFKLRTVFVAGTAVVRVELQVRNIRAAVHPSGLWDLGDPGSCLLKDLTLSCFPSAQSPQLRWQTESPGSEQTSPAGHWCLYQDSSGGEQWQSPNHVDRTGLSTVRFRGYRALGGGGGAVLAEGQRAIPVLQVIAGNGAWVGAAVERFWENFPKALRWVNGILEVGLFPREGRGNFELQGGEQKTHTVFLEFGGAGDQTCLPQLQRPLEVSIDAPAVEASGVVNWFSAPSAEDDRQLAGYVGQIVTGPRSFFVRREMIDEYGWRNFGELYADHEAVNHHGPKPFISHYNNQYDFVYGAFVNFLRSGDHRWRRLMEDAARHHIDIDIYHTQEDKAAFNGGLFWHTDHYREAATCTHRTYSRRNATGAGYGGGPSNEQNYTSGFLHYYYLTGDREAALTVQELADWVIRSDDGARTVFSLFDSGATGGASKTVDASYHRPGRGAGNSINALLDAYTVSRQRRYLEKAEEIVQRCIHPADDIAALQLDDPEHRWSYLVFLQVLGKYLAHKRELGELDYSFQYARASLLHYAGWMTEHEVPYKDVLHKVEFPTETWAAHDIRKCHVLNVAADYASGTQRVRLRRRAAFFFERCLDDLLAFPTADLTRPLVILSVWGPVQDYYRKRPEPAEEFAVHNYDFGIPSTFVPQRARVRSALRARGRVIYTEVARVVAAAVHATRLRMWGPR